MAAKKPFSLDTFEVPPVDLPPAKDADPPASVQAVVKQVKQQKEKGATKAMTYKLPVDLIEAVKRRSLESQLSGKDLSQSEIVSEGIRLYFKKHNEL